MTVKVNPDRYESCFIPEPCVLNPTMGPELDPEDIAGILFSFCEGCTHAAAIAGGLGALRQDLLYIELARTVRKTALMITEVKKEIDEFNSGMEARIHGTDG